MKLKFKVQPYQTNAVESVVDCFAGQTLVSGIGYRIDPGRKAQTSAFEEGFKNADIQLADTQVLANIRDVQKRQNLPISDALTVSTGCKFNLDVEMETGTGKTYCYIKTIFEMNKRFGWSKFIIMVPSIAIREGVYKSLQITADHFTENYGKKARFFIYNSKRLHELESFSSDAGINVMVINIQAFAARGADNRRIYDELDDFQSRRPIDVIASNRPILILDEPQKMEGAATRDALPKFKPLMILRYSATHKTQHNRVHRLDALDAYNQKLVKKIAVRGIQTRGLAGTNAYLYLESIEISKKAPVARLELEVRLKSGEIKRQLRKLEFRDDLFTESGELDQYRDGFTVSQIDYNNDTLEFTNGIVLKAGEAIGDVSERDIRRIQIRETIKAHFDKERQLFAQGIKVLSLFFIDEVVKYRDYSQADEKGEYAHVFEEEYDLLRTEYLSELAIENESYRKFLERDPPVKVHEGYFSIDKQKRLVDPDIKKSGEDKGMSDDADAYDLILKNKERLLSQGEPVRFIFSHSALREGWDNPNVFVMCMLKHSDNTVSRRQEVGRGLRLAVNQHGDRMDHPSTVHDTNVLTVVASESYKNFVAGLQAEIADTLSARPRKATEAFFTGKTLATETGPITVTAALAKQLYRYLVKNDYTDDADQIADAYHDAKAAGTLADLPSDLKPYEDQIFDLIDTVFSEANLPKMEDGRKPKTNPLNANFDKKEFQALWSRINQRAVYRVEFDSAELIKKCISALDSQLRVTPLQYTVKSGVQLDSLTREELVDAAGFNENEQATYQAETVTSLVRYDLLGKIGEGTQLTRKTVAEILTGIQASVFAQFRQNPEHFISEATRIIHEQKASMVIERLTYDGVSEKFGIDIFTAAQTGQDFSRATAKLKHHVYDYAILDSAVERDFISDLDNSKEVVVYAKLPRGFLIPTPVGDYNPDWAISFEAGSVKHVYFVAETKGTMSSLKLRELENTKIACARKFFDEIGKRVANDKLKYDVVTDYAKLMDIVSTSTA
ncbi:type III restriction-modification system endonuclease [Rhizobium metallidurans]|uniref:Type III restriction enzyme n=1 Tax=Rhizobium metallidurans TaxID=1265931 RepID=A0A7W6CV70_9HYPH|nr:DEAD/DEAH box helicase family protein [Rhizobium metallidurans]MBB3965733.1 type III restriction enzyme [Rhizobium metallidurans]